MWETLNKPQYFFSPSLLASRLKKSLKKPQTFETVRLPWNAEIRVRTSDLIGHALYTSGFFDLIVSEAVWRLIEKGDQVIDVGANIGYMTSLMASRVGKSGKVTAFEPHPLTFKELVHNVQNFMNYYDVNNIDIYQLAVSNKSGTDFLNVSNPDPAFAAINRENNAWEDPKSNIEVSVTRLDDIFDETEKISLIKIDVEGHEMSVLEGADNLISKGKIKHIVFEEHGQYPTPTMEFLASKGYTLWSLGRNFWGPVLFAPNEPRGRQLWDPPNYLATKEPNWVLARMKSRGWQVLTGGGR